MDDIDQSRFQNRPVDCGWLDSEQATTALGVKSATLYTYVSRGLLRRATAEDGRSRYAAEDVERLRARKQARAGHGAVAAEALRWGQPVIDTRIGGIGPRGPFYRGRLAVELAQSWRFEDVVNLLWEAEGAWSLLDGPTGSAKQTGGALLQRMMGSLLGGGTEAWVPGAQVEVGRRILRTLLATVPGLVDAPRPALDRVLILLADHELNASTLAVRVAASTGADPGATVLAGLATLSGPRHGGAGGRVEAMLAEVGRGDAGTTLGARLRRGDTLPGIGHPLYPEGDPRCPPLLALARELAPEQPIVRAAEAVAAACPALGLSPNVDLGLVAASVALGLPPGHSVGLFAVGRAAGWLAHGAEQRAAGWLLRPRARYVGRPVE